MQAIILAAGMGRRLGALTKDNTKCMVEVNGVKLIDRIIGQLDRHRLSRIVIVTGYKGDELESYLRERYGESKRIEFIRNPVFDKTNNIYSLYLAKDALAEEDTLLLESDLIVEDAVLDRIIEAPGKDLALVDKYQTWMDGTMLTIDADCNIMSFVPKQAFRYEDRGHYYKTVNIYKFSRDFAVRQYIPFLEAYSRVMGNNEYYEQVLRVLTLIDRSTLKALPLDGEKWYEIDDIQDLDIASTLFSSGETKYHEYHKRYGGFWRFPQLLDYCYLVNPFFPPRKMREELKANFDVLLENYPSGMGVNSMLAGRYFGIKPEYVVVGNGAAELIKTFTERHCSGKVGVIFPTFDEYPNRLPAERLVQFVVSTPDFSYTADELIAFFTGKQIETLLLVNPDNPSGHFMPLADVMRLADWCKENGVRFLVDESFVDFTEGFERNSLLRDETLERYPGMFVMKSISKSYGVPGLRLGILAGADSELIARFKKEVSIWNINSFGEFYMQIFGKYQDSYTEACRRFIAERERFGRMMDSIPWLRVIPSQANYFLCEVTDRFTSAELTRRLIAHDVLISNCGLKRNMQGRQLVRFAVRSPRDNDRLVAILKSL